MEMTIPISKAHNYRSKFEAQIAGRLEEQGVLYDYETKKIKFIRPSREATYTPDFILPNGIIIEAKGQFVTSDRQKHLWIRDQHPELDIRFVFFNPNQKIGKRSKTSYGDWCEKKGFLYAQGLIPQEWIMEIASK